MIKIFYTLLIFLFIPNIYAEDTPKSHIVTVSIAPYKFFVERIAGNTAKVVVMVPENASFHTYEPTPRQVLESAKADVWFRIGESFENRSLQAIKSHRPDMRIVDLRDNVSLITFTNEEEKHRCCCCHEGADLHIWLSPKMAKIQSKTIETTLSELYPENKLLYQERLKALLQELDTLDSEITQILSPLKVRIMMVSHPAYAYLARDYDLKQLPIEFEGREPTARQLTTILTRARDAHIKTIFIQPQHSSKGAYLIAKELGANVVSLNPYSDNYFSMMCEIAKSIAAQNNF